MTMASVRRRLSAALCMVLISLVMLATSTYAWFTLSVAPEAKSINTTVAGNGSLEIALMPASGELADVTSGRLSSGEYAGKTQTDTVANTRWGNLVDVDNAAYGLNYINLMPTQSAFTPAISFGAPEFGNDGRVSVANAALLKSFDTTANKFNSDDYGVRTFVTSDVSDTVLGSGTTVNAYGYVLDLVFRVNVKNGDDNAKLTLTDSITRINGVDETEVMGSGTSLGSDIIRVAFVKDYGVDGGTPELLATARISGGSVKLYSPAGAEVTYITELEQNMPMQISAIIYFDGASLTNADFAVSGSSDVDVSLQFATDVALTAATDTYVH